MAEEHEEEKRGILLAVEEEPFAFLETVRSSLEETGWEVHTSIGFDSNRYGFIYAFLKRIKKSEQKVMIKIIYRAYPERVIDIKAGLAPPWSKKPEWNRAFSIDEMGLVLRFWKDITYDLEVRYGVF